MKELRARLENRDPVCSESGCGARPPRKGREGKKSFGFRFFKPGGYPVCDQHHTRKGQ
jgi:hypothetical protein